MRLTIDGASSRAKKILPETPATVYVRWATPTELCIVAAPHGNIRGHDAVIHLNKADAIDLVIAILQQAKRLQDGPLP